MSSEDNRPSVGIPQEIQDKFFNGELGPTKAMSNPYVGETMVSDGGESKEDTIINLPPASVETIRVTQRENSDIFVENPNDDISEHDAFLPSSIEALLSKLHDDTGYRALNLPSRGYMYPENSPLRSGVIWVRALRSAEEELILQADKYVSGESLEKVMRKCSAYSNAGGEINVGELLSEDRRALLVYMRGITYGSDYSATFRCPSCGSSYNINIDLDSDLPMAYAINPDIKEPFSIVLPSSKIVVKYRLPRGTDEVLFLKHRADVESKSKSKSKDGRDDSLRKYINGLIVAIGGKDQDFTDRESIEKVMNTLSLNDVSYIRGKIERPPFGIDMSVTVNCTKCGGEQTTIMPMGIDFFIQSGENALKKNERIYSKR